MESFLCFVRAVKLLWMKFSCYLMCRAKMTGRTSVLDFTMQLLETGVENDLVLSLVVFSLQYLLVNHEYWKYKETLIWKIGSTFPVGATAGFNSHLLATSVYANMLKVLQVIKTCIISTLVPGKLGEVIRGACYIVNDEVTHHVIGTLAVQVGATKVLSLLLTISDYSQPYFSGNACFGFDDNQIADLRHSVESSLQSGEHEDLFVASVNLLTSAAHYQPAFLIAFFSTTESEDVPQSNDSGMNRSANEASSGLLGSKKSGVINAILLYIERSDDLIKSNPRVLLNVLHFLKALWQGAGQYTNILESLKSSGKFWKHLSNSFSLITRLQSPVLEGITEVESHNLAYKYQWANTNLQPAVSYGTHKNV
ncbi:hypothetical protein KPL71_023355 [Citrus sinensis]|uniref:Uncharacterized protein n=1 Tax=Citrus sinensis TaxID=2711 RepID=A0ACB8IIG2_CITSI|nr:hypothetical protein KPL71_023355 [Citrus sinensis]